TLLHRQQQGVVVSVYGRLQVLHHIGTAHHWIEHCPYRTPNNEVCAQRVQSIRFQDPVMREFPLHASVKLLHHGILHVVVDDVDATRASARKDEAAEGIGKGWRTRTKMPRWVEENWNASI